MGPIAKEVAANYADKSVQFVTFDFTSDESKAEAARTAKELGVAGTYAENEGTTGFALVYDTKNQKVVTTLSAKQEAADWGTVLDKALDGA